MHTNIEPWRVTESTITYEDRWIRLRSDTCYNQKNTLIAPFHVLEYPDWVNVVALTSDDQIVLVREYRHGAGEVLLGFPGGTMEANKQDPLLTIQRELQEETGYTGDRFVYLGSSYANPANQTNRLHTFLALDVTLTHPQHLDEAELIEVVIQDFLTFSQQVWNGAMTLQAMHLGVLSLCEHYIRRSEEPRLQRLSAAL